MADKDYEQFQKQRDSDVKNILIEHIKTQLKLCKLVIMQDIKAMFRDPKVCFLSGGLKNERRFDFIFREYQLGKT